MIDKEKYPKVYSIMFGEGLMNDAVSVIIFKAVTIVAPSGQSIMINASILFELLLNFTYISVCSLLVGLFFGFLHAYTLRRLRHISHKPHFEIGLTIFFGLLSYLIGEAFELSGIIGTTFKSIHIHL